MELFTIETTYRLPVYRHRTYEAETVEQACRLAIEDDEWDEQKRDYETAGGSYVSGAWRGDTAYSGRAEHVPSRFEETNQRKVDHFETLLGLLKIFAQERPLDKAAREFWGRAPGTPSRRERPSSAASTIPANRPQRRRYPTSSAASSIVTARWITSVPGMRSGERAHPRFSRRCVFRHSRKLRPHARGQRRSFRPSWMASQSIIARFRSHHDDVASVGLAGRRPFHSLARRRRVSYFRRQS